MFTYCEGAKAAEILFSLTGGREGRLMSYAPPVSIYFGYAYKTSCSCIELQYVGNSIVNQVWHINKYIYTLEKIVNARETHYLDPKYQGYGFPINCYSATNELIEVVNLWTCDFQNHAQPILGNFPYTPEESPQGWDKSYGKSMRYGYNIPQKNLLLIKDIEGVLYAHQVPDGFTPTWQVNCIGCNPGECAGADGKGGVVCMDCADMDRNIQAIKRSLSR